MNPSEFKLNLAVVIGINNYQNGIPQLGTARQDAEAIADILKTQYHYQVHLLTESQATAQNLKQWLETDLPEAIKQDNPSRLLFYFAGHGIALNGDEGPQGYLIPQDAKLGEVSTYLPMQQVEAALTQLSCRHCLVILDCCFAGAFRWSSTRKLIPITETIHKERFDRFIQDPAWQVITSAASDQFALDNLDLKGDRGIAKSNTNHSPFAAALIEALSGSADAYPPANNGKPAGDGVITATELYMYLRDAVEVPTDTKNQRQTPQIWCLKKHDKGEFIFLPPGHELNLPPASSLDELEDHNPYRGLKSYETKDSALFFGRTALIDKLCDAMSDRPFTVVLGASGSGKSSLVKAGLIAHLDGSAQSRQSANQRLKPQDNPHVCKSRKWQILTPIRPGESPLNSLNGVLKELGNTDQLESKTLSEAISNWSQSHPQTKLLLVIDQLEELITLCRNDEERRQFLDLLAELVQAYPEVVRLVVTLRSDFEPQLRTTPLEPLWQDGRFVVPAMTRDELRAVIEEPASAKVVYFESLDDRGYLVDQLIDEVAGMPGALPLLSFALSELYLKLARRYLEAQNTGDTVERAITWGDYDALGGVTKSLTQRADEVYEDLLKVDPAYEKTIRHMMLRMVAVGGELARRQVPESELKYPEPENGRVQEVLRRFSTARLLVSGTDADDKPYIEPAHDALVRGWEKLLKWKQQNLADLLLQRELTSVAIQWTDSINKKQSQGLLWDDDPRLPIAMKLLCESDYKDTWLNFWKWLKGDKLWKEKSSNFWLNTSEETFVVNSFEQKYKKRRNTVGIALGVLMTLSGLTLWAIFNANTAENRRINADIRAFSLSSKNLVESNQLLEATINAIRAGRLLEDKKKVGIEPETQMQAITALQRVIYTQRLPIQIELPNFREINRLEGHNSGVRAISFSNDGNIIASGSEDNTIQLWKRDGTLHKTLKGHIKTVRSISFSPDNRTLVSASDDKTLKLWNLENGSLIRSFEGHTGTIPTVSFSPDGQRIASASADGTIKIWNQEAGLIKTIEKAHPNPIQDGPYVQSVQFSPDSTLLVSGGYDGLVKLWRIDGKFLKSFNHGSIVWDTKFSPDGQTIASAGEDGTVKLWSRDGLLLRTLKGHLRGVRRVTFSPDGETIASTSADNTVKIWNRNGPLQFRSLKGHSSSVWDAAFSPVNSDAQILASASADGTVKLWRRDETVLRRLDVGFIPEFIRFSPNGKIIATSSGEGTVLWNIENNQVSSLGTGPTDNVSFSLDGQILAIAGSHKKNVQLWSLTTEEHKIFEGHKDVVSSVLFNPHEKLFISGSWDGTVKLWNYNNLNGKISKSCANNDYVSSLSFSPDGKLLAFGSWDNTVKLWNWNLDCKAIETVITHGARVQDVSFSPDGKMIASASSDNTIKLWTLGETEPRTLRGHNAWVLSLSFHPNGKILATGSSDQTVKLWSIDSGSEIETLRSHKPVEGRLGMWPKVSFSPDGKTLASTSPGDETVVLWNFDLPGLLDQACGVARDYLKTNPNVSQDDKNLCE